MILRNLVLLGLAASREAYDHAAAASPRETARTSSASVEPGTSRRGGAARAKDGRGVKELWRLRNTLDADLRVAPASRPFAVDDGFFQKQVPGSGGELATAPRAIRTHSAPPQNRSAADGGGAHLETLAEVPLDAVAAREAAAYRAAEPYRHAVIDGLIPDAVARGAMREIRAFDRWQTRRTPQGRKGGLGGSTDMRQLGPHVEALMGFFQSRRFVRFLEQLTAIDNLTKDETLVGAGPFSVPTDGYLALHTDFNQHRSPATGEIVTPGWRRVNALLYLNEHWKDEYGGAFELWATDQKYTFLDYRVKVVPQFNRLVVFSVTDVSIHGHLDLVCHPSGEPRKTISMYYYTPHVDDEPLITQKIHGSIYMPGSHGTRSRKRWRQKRPAFVVR